MATITIIGSGGMAAAIGGLAVEAGHAIEVMSRDTGKAEAFAARLGTGVTVGSFGGTPAGDLVILAVPYAAVLDVVKRYGQRLGGKILVDITNPITPDLTGFLTPEGSFGTREIVGAAPADATVVKAFNTLPSKVLAAGSVEDHPLDVYIAGDDEEAKLRVSTFIDSLGLRPMDAGPLFMARTLEHACMLWLGLRVHSVSHAGFSLGVRRFG